MTKFKVMCHLLTAQVQIAVFLTQVFPSMSMLVQLKRQCLAASNNLNLLCPQLNLTRLDGLIDKAFFPLNDLPRHSNDILFANVFQLSKIFNLTANEDLKQSLAVPQFNKGQLTVIADIGHPASCGHGLSDLL